MINYEVEAGSPVYVPFAGATGLTAGDFTFTVVTDGVSGPQAPTALTEPAPGAYVAEYTFADSGQYIVIVGSDIVANIGVVDLSKQTLLQNLEDVAMGSWQWDKSTGSLKFYRQNGDEFADFNVVEDGTTASRERV